MLGIIVTPVSSGRGSHEDFFFTGLGLALLIGAKLVSINNRPSIFSIIFTFFFPGGRKKNCAVFCTIRLDVL